MKRLVAGLLVAAAWVQACSGSDEGGAVAPSPVEEAGTVVEAGREEDTSAVDATTPDQSVPDVAADAPVRGNVHVLVIKAGSILPSPDAKVVFVEPDGATTVRSVNPSDGTVTAAVLAGTTMTVVQTVGTFTSLETIEAIELGDDIVAGVRAALRPPADVSVVFEPYPITIPITYRINFGCFSTGGTENFTSSFTVPCPEQNGMVHVYVEARNNAGTLLAMAGKDVAGGQTASFVEADWKDATARTFDLATVPNMTRYDARVYFGKGTTWNFGAGVGVTPLSFGRPAAGQVDLECQNATASASDFNYGWRVGQLDCGPPQAGDLVSLGSPAPIMETITVATSMDRRPMLTWSTAAPMAGAFAAVASAYSRVSLDGDSHAFAWTMVTPAKVNYAQPPPLPAALAALVPMDVVWFGPSVTLYGAAGSAPGGVTAKSFRQAPDELGRIWENGWFKTNPSTPTGQLHVRWTGRNVAN